MLMASKVLSMENSITSRRTLLSMMLALAGVQAVSRRVLANGEDYHVHNFGVFPYLPALKLEHLFAPMVSEFCTILGCPIQLRTKSTFEEFRAELANQAYDIALLHPFFLVEAQQHYGYVKLARVDDDLSGVILGCPDKGLKGIGSLRGKVLALPPRLAGVSYLTVLALAENGLEPGVDIELRHYRTKVSCLHAIATGEADGCVIPSFMVDQLDAVKRMGLVTIAETAPIPGLAFAALESLEAGKRESLKRQMLAWDTTARGRAVLERVHWSRIVEATDQDYALIGVHNALLTKYAMR